MEKRKKKLKVVTLVTKGGTIMAQLNILNQEKLKNKWILRNNTETGT